MEPTQGKEEKSSSEDEVMMMTDTDAEAVEIVGEGTEEYNDEELAAMNHPSNRQDDSLCSFEGHSDSVYSVDIRFVGETALAASGGGDDKCFLWDASNGNKFFELSGHKDSVSSVRFNGDASLLASSSFDGTVKVWNVKDGSLAHTLEGPAEGINWMTWHPKGNVVLAGSQDSSCWMWNAANGTFMGSFFGHSKSVGCGIFSSDGKTIITGSEDTTVRVWDPKNAECLHTFQGAMFHEAEVVSVASQVQNPSLVLTGSQDTTAKVINISNGKILGALNGHTDSVESVAFSSTLPFGVTASLDSKILVWDLNTLQVRSSSIHEAGVVSCAWHPVHHHLLISASLDKSVRVWDVRSGSCEKVYKGHMNGILSMAISSDGRAIVTGSDDQSALVYVVKQ